MGSLSQDDMLSLQRKVIIMIITVVLFIGIVLARLMYLQVLHGKSLRMLSNQISVREEEIRAKRGLILDRWGKVIADSRSYFEITLIPQYLQHSEKTFATLEKLVPISNEELQAIYSKNKLGAPFMPVTIAQDVSFDWVSKIRERQRGEYNDGDPYFLEGIEVRESPIRVYLYPELFAHALGYLKEIDTKGLEQMEVKHPGIYSLGDLLGASGIERAYDLELKGEDGVRSRVVDARGREVRGNLDLDLLVHQTSISPIPGKHLVTTLDFNAQQAAAKAMAGKRGAVVAIEPSSGEVLVMLSQPSFDGNRILRNVDRAYWKMINLHEDKFLYNRAIQATYPPGSIYKVVPALAGLETGAVDPETHFSCGGGMQFGSRFFKCWNKGGHGSVNLLRGLAQSCDVYFYNVGLRVGVDGLHEYASYFGLGRKTGIEIAYEQSGLIPTAAWKQKRYKQDWIESETLSVAIGQGYDLVTPLQAAKMGAMIANGGHEITPHLGKELRDSLSGEVKKIEYPVGESKIPLDHLKRIQAGMIEVVQGAGTATKLKTSRFLIAGKTGTAQVVGHDSGITAAGRTLAHGWFMAYAPYEDPKIAIAVIVENGGSGSGAAAPVAREVIDAYLNQIFPLPSEKTANDNPTLEERH